MRWPRNSPNGLRAGKHLANGYCGCLWSLIGDLDYLVSILKLPNFNSSRPCSLCRCSLAGANSWSDFSPSALWRNQLWTLTAWKNWEGRSQCPLFGCLSYCSALTVHLDYMHCKYLGVDQYVYASVLALLCCQVMSGTPQENLNRCWRTIKEYYHRHQTRIRYRYLNKLTMFLRKSGTPKLRGKAGEIRHFAPVICHLWTLHMDSNFEVHQQIHMLLKCADGTADHKQQGRSRISSGRSTQVLWSLWKHAHPTRRPCQYFRGRANWPFYIDIKMPHAPTHCDPVSVS